MRRYKESLAKRLPWRPTEKHVSSGHQKPSHDYPANRTCPTTFRVRCLPPECDWDSTKSLLEETLASADAKPDILLHSLAYDSGYSRELTATITSDVLSQRLQEPETQWVYNIAKRDGLACAQQPHGRPIIIDSHFEGLTPLNSFKSNEEHHFDCIALTGLGGHAFNSFKEKDGHYMWLRDSLPAELPGVRVYLYGYDTKLVASRSFQDLEALASTFRRIVVTSRRSSSATNPHLPLVFVAHSLGGIVLKEALIQMSDDDDPGAQSTHAATYAILFFGCPNQGIEIKSLIPMCQGQPNLPFLLSLAPSSERLRQLCREFPKKFPFQDSKIISLYETKLSHTAQFEDGTWAMTGPLEVLVSRSSAVHSRPGEDEPHHIHALNRDHSELVRFAFGDADYAIVLGFLNDFALRAPIAIKARLSDTSVHQNKENGQYEQTWDPQQEQSYSDLLRWLAPQQAETDHYTDDLEDARSLRHYGTCQWVEERAEYKAWRSLEARAECDPLWICGIPGAGKTVLSSYLIDHAARGSHDTGLTILYFFFKNGNVDKNTPLAAARALIHQLLELCKQRELFLGLQHCMKIAAHPKAINFKHLWELFCRYCCKLPNSLLILDALDECADVYFLLPGLLDLAKTGSIRVAITSRYEPELVSKLSNLLVLEMGPDDVANDIEAYVDYEVHQSTVLSNPLVRPRVIRALNARSKGMFLWTALMIKELASLTSIGEIDETLKSAPQDIDGLYGRIVKRLHTSLKPAKRLLCTRVLKWITLAKRPLHTSELEYAMRMEYARASGGVGFDQNLLYSGKELELICGSLVSTKHSVVQLIHLSTKDYLTTPVSKIRLGIELHDFLVSKVEDNAHVAKELICFLPVCTPIVEPPSNDNDSDESDTREPPQLMEYAIYHWILHVIDSKPNVIQKHMGAMKEFFEQYRHWWSWITLYLRYNTDNAKQLRVHLQNLVEWSNSAVDGNLNIFITDSPKHTMSIWAESLMRVLDDYDIVLADTSVYSMYDMDPSVTQLPIVGKLPFWEFARHKFLRSQTVPHETLAIPFNRQLPKNAAEDDGYAFFSYDKLRGALFFLNASDTGSGLQCQEAETGRRLSPIHDPELKDFQSRDTRVLKAVKSGDDKYIAISYILFFTSDQVRSAQVYTAVWYLQETIHFDRTASPKWARKVLSTTMSVEEEWAKHSPLAFLGKTRLCHAGGYIDLRTGVGEPLPRLSSHAFEHEDARNVMSSGDGQHIFWTFQALTVNFFHKSLSGNIQQLHELKHSWFPELLSVSHKGRYILWQQAINEFAYDLKYCMLDRFSNKIRDLDAPATLRPCKGNQFIFTSDERGLVGIFDPVTAPAGETYTHIIFWNLDPEVQIRGSRLHKGSVLGHFLDEEERQLHVISQERTWNRYDLDTQDLCSLEPEMDNQHTVRMEHATSQDGSKFASLHWGIDHIHLQVISLPQEQTVMVDHNLNLPHQDYQDALVAFSPDVSLVFIGNVVLHTLYPDVEPRLVPVEMLHQASSKSGEPEGTWACTFAACLQYMALYFDPMNFGRTPTPQDEKLDAKLCVFDLLSGGNSVIGMPLSNVDISASSRLYVQFHPAPECSATLLISSRKYTSRTFHRTVCQLLDVRTEAIEQLGSEDSRQPNLPHVRLSACGTYAILPMQNPAMGHVLWPIATWRAHEPFGTISCAPAPSTAKSLFSKLMADPNEYWNQFSFLFSIQAQRVYISLWSIDGRTVSNCGQVELTFVPKYLAKAHVTMLVGDVSETTKLRLLFVTGERVEMKELDASLMSILSRFREWWEWKRDVESQGRELEWLERLSEAQEDEEDSCSTLSFSGADRSASPA